MSTSHTFFADNWSVLSSIENFFYPTDSSASSTPTTTELSVDSFRYHKRIAIKPLPADHFEEAEAKLAHEVNLTPLRKLAEHYDHAAGITPPRVDFPAAQSEAMVREFFISQLLLIVLYLFLWLPCFNQALLLPEKRYIDEVIQMGNRIIAAIEWKTANTLPAWELLVFVRALRRLTACGSPIWLVLDDDEKGFHLEVEGEPDFFLPEHIGWAASQCIRYIVDDHVPSICLTNGNQYLIFVENPEQEFWEGELYPQVYISDTVWNSSPDPPDLASLVSLAPEPKKPMRKSGRGHPGSNRTDSDFESFEPPLLRPSPFLPRILALAYIGAWISPGIPRHNFNDPLPPSRKIPEPHPRVPDNNVGARDSRSKTKRQGGRRRKSRGSNKP